MPDLFSQRTANQPEGLSYEIPVVVRRRVLITLCQQNDWQGYQINGREILAELGAKLSAEYGGLFESNDPNIYDSDPVVEHFLCCRDTHAVDFIERWFQCSAYRSENRGVDAVNRIFRQEGIGYELTPFVIPRIDGTVTPAFLFGGQAVAGFRFPEIIKKDSEITYAEIVKPCLDLLASPTFSTANSEMLDAFRKYREGDFDGALTSCGSAFESVLKTICDKKSWTYDPGRDTLAKLVDICNAKSLFPPFYSDAFKSVGVIRNKISDAHGRGPMPGHTVTQSQVEHLLHVVSSHIVFLAKEAKV